MCPPGEVVERKRQIEYGERKASTMKNAWIVLALLSAGCGHGVRSAPDPQAETTVRVENRNFLDMTVYIVHSSQRIRLGMVTGLSTQVFTIPGYIVRGSGQLQFELHPIGGRGNPRTESISVQPGDEVNLIVPP
jgi:hypothetical protein